MNQKVPFFTAVISPLLAGSIQGQELFSDDFNTDSSTDYTIIATTDSEFQFGFDYSALGIPAAPNTTDDSTLGLRMAANLLQGAEAGVTLATVEEFTGDYSVSFDMWLNANGPFPGGGSGSTEFATAGVGSDATVTNLGGFSGSGGWIAVDGEGGSSRDYRMYKFEVEQFPASGQYVSDNNHPDPLFLNFGGIDVGNLPVQGEIAQQTGPTLVGSAGFAWRRVVLTVDSKGGTGGATSVEWSIDGITIGTLDAGNGTAFETDGSATIGYMDIFSSISDNPMLSFGLIDNLVIEVAQARTIRVNEGAAFATLNQDSTSSTSSYTIDNRDESNALTVSEVNFTGTDAASFALDTALPVVIPVGGSATFDITFTANGDRGPKTAQVEFVSTDALDPNVTLDLDAFFANVLLAHYKLDETEGNAVIEASGNGPEGSFIVRDDLTYAAEGLAGGTSIEFTAADAGDVGNFALMNPPHVPTTSISMWIKPAEGFGGQDTLFNRDPGFSGTDSIYGCFIEDAGRLTFRTGGEVNVTSEDGAITDDQVHHVVITHLDDDGFGNDTATRTRMYIDGVMVSENTSPVGFDAYPASFATNSLYLATRTAAGAGYDGLMDDVQIYSIELTPEQVESMFLIPGNTASESAPDLAITDFTYNSGTGEGTIIFNSIPTRTYVIQQSDNLIDWDEFVDSIESEGRSTTVEFTAEPADGGVQFFRVAPEE